MSLEVCETGFGKFLIDPQDVIDATTKAGTLWDGPGFLQPIVQEYGRLGEAGVTILDVGAHHGAFSVWLASQGAWRVLAVEPVPETYQRLLANLDLNQAVTAARVIPIPMAGYDRVCQMRVAGAVDAGNTGGTALVGDPTGPICGVPLGEFAWLCGGFISLIKVDAQGCDGRVLQGMEFLLTRDRWVPPVVVFEWEADLAVAHGLSFVDVETWFGDCGYGVHTWPSHPNNFLARKER